MRSQSQASIINAGIFRLRACVAGVAFTVLLIYLVSGVDGFTTTLFSSNITPKQRLFGSDRPNQIKNQNGVPLTQFSLKSSKFDKDTAKSVVKQLWFLPVLSLLSGVSPACRIISESHISRLPDCPIAHDIDTRLLWPAIAASESGLPPSVFRTPVGAITDERLYNVDWALVWNAYFFRVGISMGISVTLTLCVIYFLSKDGDDYASTVDGS